MYLQVRVVADLRPEDGNPSTGLGGSPPLLCFQISGMFSRTWCRKNSVFTGLSNWKTRPPVLWHRYACRHVRACVSPGKNQLHAEMDELRPEKDCGVSRKQNKHKDEIGWQMRSRFVLDVQVICSMLCRRPGACFSHLILERSILCEVLSEGTEHGNRTSLQGSS